MAAGKDEVGVLSLILEGQKELREDIKVLIENVATQAAKTDSVNKQCDRIVCTLDIHSEILSEHTSQLSVLEAFSQETSRDTYRYNKRNLASADKQSDDMKSIKKALISFPPQSTSDIIKFVVFGILGLAGVVSAIIQAL